MEVTDLSPLLEQLDDDVDNLEEVIAPLLARSLTETSKKLPVLDKAKLHICTVYALESLIFAYLRLRGVNAKEHPVFREIARVRQYFDKVKALETEPEQRNMTVDKEAAGRFIKHGLAGNDRLDTARQEQEAKNKARAQLKVSMLAKKGATENPPKQKEAPEESDSDVEDIAAKSNTRAEPRESKSDSKTKRKAKREASKAAKRQERIENKADRRESKQERRQRKLEKRKAREAKEAK